LEPTISAGKRPQTYALDHAATGTGVFDGHYPILIVPGHIGMASIKFVGVKFTVKQSTKAQRGALLFL
jgi:hypothetical protein